MLCRERIEIMNIYVASISVRSHVQAMLLTTMHTHDLTSILGLEE